MSRRVSAAVVVFALVILVAGHCSRAADVVSPSEFNEGPIAAVVARWQSEPLGPHWLDGPHVSPMAYGPGYHAAVRALSAVWPDDPLRPGRVISTLAALAAAGLLGFAVGRSTQSPFLGGVAACFYLAAPIARQFADRQRVDSLATLFSIAAYVCATAGPRGLALSAVCVVGGSFVKQTVALAALPVVVWLVAYGRWKAAITYGTAVVGAGLAGWWALDAAAGGLFGRSALAGQMNHMDFGSGWALARDFLLSPPGAAGLIALALVLALRGRDSAREMPAVAFVINLGLMTVLAAKDGASAAYYLEASALAVWVIAALALPALSRGEMMFAPLVALVCLGAASAAARDVKALVAERRWGPAPVAAMLREHLSSGESGFVLADSHSLDDVVAVGRTPLISDPYLVRLLTDNGGLSPDAVVRALSDGSVPVVVFSQSLATRRAKVHLEFPAAVFDAVERNYALEFEGDHLFLYRFAGRK